MRVLLAEDDARLAESLVCSLKQAGYAVDWTDDGDEAELILKVQDYDLVILDLTLPGMDGLELLGKIRTSHKMVPVLITTARSEVEDRIRGLDLGADDYLTKPFELGEFDARVRALLRRSAGRGLNKLVCGALSLDLAGRRAFLNSEPLNLPKREYHILEALATRQGQILSKTQIIDRILDFDEELSPSAIEIYIHRLRKRLEGEDIIIRTVRGVGYMLV